MKKWKSFLVLVLTVVIVLAMTACSVGNYVNIPSGYVGKILRPTGWDEDWLTAGQVDLGIANNNGSYNQLVLLQTTSETYLEAFGSIGSFTDGQDHRILTQDGVPCEVNVTLRMIVPEDNDSRDAILAQVSPKQLYSNLSTVTGITVSDIYLKFAQSEVRSVIRATLAMYESYNAIYADYANVSDKLGEKIGVIFDKAGVPLKLMQVALSNVKPDETVWSAKNQNAAAASQVSTIQEVGKAIEANPGYLEYMKWQYLKDIAQTGTNVTIVIGDSGDSNNAANDFAAAQYVIDKLEERLQLSPTSAPAEQSK